MSKIVVKIYFWLANLLYHQFAWSYDWVAAMVSAGMWQGWILSLLPDLPGPRVLELGHGPGHLQTALLEKGVSVYGLDRSPQMSRLARRRAHKLGFVPALAQGIAQQLPFHSSEFDQVVATFPTPYISDPKTLAEIYRVLRPGGLLLVLPGVTITQPKNIAEKFGAWLFRTVGLTVKNDHHFKVRLEQPVQEAGFQAEVQERPYQSATMFLILARKT